MASMIQKLALFMGRSKNSTKAAKPAIATRMFTTAKSSGWRERRATRARRRIPTDQVNTTRPKPTTPIRASKNRNVLCGIPRLNLSGDQSPRYTWCRISRPNPTPRTGLWSQVAVASFQRMRRNAALVSSTPPITLAPEDYFVRKRAEYNALALKGLTGCEVSLLPRLDVDGMARTGVLAKLHAAGYTGGPIVCIHNRAGNPIREWRAASFAAVLDLVGDLVQFVVVIDDGVDLSGPRVELPASMRSTVWKSDLANLKALLSVADVLLCCDSGVMHMGAACGCRVVAIFGPTSLDIFAPHGARHQIVKVDPMPCRPCLDSCIYSRPICMDEIIEGVVSAALRRAIVAGTDGSVWQNSFRSL